MEKVTIVVPIGHNAKRLPMLCRRLNSLSAASQLLIEEVVLNWNTEETVETIPLILPHRIFYNTDKSLNNRFKVQNICTEGVVQMDDDFAISDDILIKGIQKWQEDKRKLLGIQKLSRSVCKSSDIYLYIPQAMQDPCIVLTPFFITHIDYMKAYNHPSLEKLRKGVDDLFNGEDLVFNYMVAKICQSYPHFELLEVELPEASTEEEITNQTFALWKKKDHLCNRSLLLHRLITENGLPSGWKIINLKDEELSEEIADICHYVAGKTKTSF